MTPPPWRAPARAALRVDAGADAGSGPAPAAKPANYRSGQCPGVFLESCPGLGTVFLLPLGIEADLAQMLTELLLLGAVENQSLLFERGLQLDIEPLDGFALFHRLVVEHA